MFSPLHINGTQIYGFREMQADSEEKHEPATDIDTGAMDSLKVLDPKRPIRQADVAPLIDGYGNCSAAAHSFA
jgi:hypothetical protein